MLKFDLESVYIFTRRMYLQKSLDLATELTPHDCSVCSNRNVHYGFNRKKSVGNELYGSNEALSLSSCVILFMAFVFSHTPLVLCHITAKECACKKFKINSLTYLSFTNVCTYLTVK